ncbi:alpha/beta fold hydrolase [Demequina aurantiaca]|uniref:alpha/beta fold hydrolase n=1 Tax=Demequina aurantiaca TaxID=676200 RepID=UPI0007863F14|nr:alpha/beta hydrolase [Demequina aurantiaca]
MFTTHTTEGPDGRTLQYYVAKNDRADGAVAGSAIPLIWFHGSPNVGEPPVPLYDAAAGHGIGWVGYDRPGYGGSTENAGRDIASAAKDVEAVADALGLGRFAVMGHSGGGAHALACAALMPDRVGAAVSISGLAPFPDQGEELTAGISWFDGLYAGSVTEMRSALAGREELTRVLEAGEYDPEMFTPEDHAALNGTWNWFNHIVKLGSARGVGGFVDDDLAAVSDWGFDVEDIRVPTLIMHGTADRVVPVSHGRWLGRHIPAAQLRLRDGAGHLSIMEGAADALSWVAQTMAAGER